MPEGQHHSDTRNVLLGKDANDFPLADGVARLVQGANEFARLGLGGQGNDPEVAQEGLQPPQIADALGQQEANVARRIG